MKITKEKFKEMYFSMNNKDLAKKLGVTVQTVINYAAKLELKKGKGYGAGAKPAVEIIE